MRAVRNRLAVLSFLGSALVLSSLAGPPPAGAAVLSHGTTVTISAGTLTAGRPGRVSVTVRPRPSGGTVRITSPGVALPRCERLAVGSGKASCVVTIPAGRHVLTARYAGHRTRSATYRASTGRRTVTVAARTSFQGGVGSCTTTSGALVAVDFAHWRGPAARGCGATADTGLALLEQAGFSVTGLSNQPGFVCRIGYAHGTQQPAGDRCATTPPAGAYWAFWTARRGSDTWTYSTVGAGSDQPQAGEVEAWTFGSTDTTGSSGRPSFTPAEVRAGLPSAGPRTNVRNVAGTAAVTPTATPTRTPDTANAAGYLVDQLSDGDHYQSYGSPDLGATLDGALALAAAGTQDGPLARIVAYVGAHQNEYTFLSGPQATYASGGSVAKVALVAEATGADPRDFDGVDLVSALDRLVCTKTVGNVCAAAGNYRYSSSTFAQALGVLAQVRAGDTSGASRPIAYLESAQHTSGAFPSTLPGTDSDTDSTAMAAMALALAPGAAARAELTRALSWLAARQEADGGFPGAAGVSVNSAALAVQALHLDAQTYARQIAAAEGFLAAEQQSDGGFAIAAGSRGSNLRASTQALSGALGTPFGSVLDDLQAKQDAVSGAGYLVAQLTDGTHYTDTYAGTTYDDQGLTADGVFALLSSGGHTDTVAAMIGYLRGQVDAYADPTGAQGGPYSGALAKLALVAEASGGDPHSFGGTDLLTILRQKVCAAAIAGDYSPCTAAGDFYNAFSTVSQALGVLALQASPVAADHLSSTSAPVVRLHQLQCPDGGFSSTLIAPGAACTPDVDTTGYAVQALAAVPGTDLWLGAAQAYLQKVQARSGLYPGAAGANANSTALAAQALQTLTRALTAPTADPPQPPTIAPILTWQSALRALRSLASTGGGFGTTAANPADLRSSTQAVAAAAQQTLLGLSGATVRSLPRAAAAGATTSTSPTSGTPTSGNASTGGPSSRSASTPIANTGTPAAAQLSLAVLLLIAGAGLTWLGRRPTLALAGRHRVRRVARHR